MVGKSNSQKGQHRLVHTYVLSTLKDRIYHACCHHSSEWPLSIVVHVVLADIQNALLYSQQLL
jgi:hypothetical protein